MSYPSGNQGYYTAAYSDSFGTDHKRLLPRYMALAVLVLGAASYLLSFGPMPEGHPGAWGVRFAVLAALLSGFGLIPRQDSNHQVIAVLAVAGFLDALAALISATNSGWALTVIVVINGLQSVVAIGALLQAHPAGDTEQGSQEAYSEYWAQMAQYYNQYPDQNSQPAETAEPLQRGAHGQAAARAVQHAADQSASYSDYVDNQNPRGATVDRYAPQTSQPAQTGLPSFARAPGQAPVQRYGTQGQHDPGPSATR
ncbi:DUF5336 domain-containing protein [Mycobacteroides salmoniphilum]|uniref:DUF5336 domain-containing protein n=1 Tax=Mycobacteroides salmoniphilum TaxID=404941 RepID=UPI000993B69B|nr:DUF5336 domain-containing protein [Mycobacteroides salmoniphilum]QCH25747.1 hypothetical protein DSM43276_04033 [Mycobacteroides salmoniphilum]